MSQLAAVDSPNGNGALRVGIDSRMPNAVAGGVQQFVIGLASGLAQLDASGEEYLFLTEPDGLDWLRPFVGAGGRLVEARTGTTQQPAGKGWYPGLRRWVGDHVPGARAARRRIARPGGPDPLPQSDGTIEAAGVDVMHFTFQGAFLTEVPSIFQPWDLQHLQFPSFFTDAELRWREVAYRTYSERARIVVVASEWARQDLVTRLGVPATKVAVIGVPAVVSTYPVPDAAAVAEIGRTLGVPESFVYYPAQTWPHKNHLRLLAAIASLREHGMVIDLVCSGGPNANDPVVRAEVNRLGLRQSVHFVGYVRPVEVHALYRLSRAMVFPSLFEGWGLPVLEAFELGVPVLCSNVTSLPELVGDAALVVDPTDVGVIADSISRIWRDDELRADLVARGRGVAARFNWATTARTYRALYRAIGDRPMQPSDQALIDESLGGAAA